LGYVIEFVVVFVDCVDVIVVFLGDGIYNEVLNGVVDVFFGFLLL